MIAVLVVLAWVPQETFLVRNVQWGHFSRPGRMIANNHDRGADTLFALRNFYGVSMNTMYSCHVMSFDLRSTEHFLECEVSHLNCFPFSDHSFVLVTVPAEIQSDEDSGPFEKHVHELTTAAIGTLPRLWLGGKSIELIRLGDSMVRRAYCLIVFTLINRGGISMKVMSFHLS